MKQSINYIFYKAWVSASYISRKQISYKSRKFVFLFCLHTIFLDIFAWIEKYYWNCWYSFSLIFPFFFTNFEVEWERIYPHLNVGFVSCFHRSAEISKFLRSYAYSLHSKNGYIMGAFFRIPKGGNGYSFSLISALGTGIFLYISTKHVKLSRKMRMITRYNISFGVWRWSWYFSDSKWWSTDCRHFSDTLPNSSIKSRDSVFQMLFTLTLRIRKKSLAPLSSM